MWPRTTAAWFRQALVQRGHSVLLLSALSHQYSVEARQVYEVLDQPPTFARRVGECV